MNSRLQETYLKMRKIPKTEFVAVLVLVILATLLRLVPILQFPPYIYLYGDMVHYDHSAVLLLVNHVYTYWTAAPSAQVTPGYPLFLAGVYNIAWGMWHSHDAQVHLALSVQALISGLTVGVVYFIAKTFLRPGWAFLAAFLWASYPSAVWASQLLLTETLYVFLLYLYAWAFIRATRRNRPQVWLLAGLLLGMTGLVRPTVFPFAAAPVLLALLQAWKNRATTRPQQQSAAFVRRFFAALGWQSFASYVAGFLVLLVPWWVRNYHVFHRLILTDTDAGNPLLFGTDPKHVHIPSSSPLNETRLALHLIHQEFIQHPLAALQWYTWSKLQILFSTPWYNSFSKATPTWLIVWVHFHLVWVVMGALGLLLGLRKPGLRLLSTLAIVLTLLQLPFIPISRYVFPIMPLFMIGVAVFAQFLADVLARKPILRPRPPQPE